MISVDSKMGETVESIKQMSSFTTRLAYQPEVTTLDAPDAPLLADLPLRDSSTTAAHPLNDLTLDSTRFGSRSNSKNSPQTTTGLKKQISTTTSHREQEDRRL